MNKHDNDKKAKRLYLIFAATAMMITVFCTSVFAETDPLAVVNNLSDFIFSLIRAIGLILLGFGILQIGLALKSHDASQRVRLRKHGGEEHRDHHGGGGKDKVEALCLFVVIVFVQECSFLVWLMGANNGVPI